MKKKSYLLLGLSLLILPVSGLFGCVKKSSSPHVTPKYILNGNKVDTASNPEADSRLNYYLLDNSNYYAVGLKESAKENTGTFDIPSKYDHDNDPETPSIPVVGIWRDGFQGSKYSTITIPNSITTIDFEAFLDSWLETVTIPSSVNEIGDAAFYSCKRLTKVVFNNSSIDSSTSSSACECIEPPREGEEQNPSQGNNNQPEITYSHLKKIPSFIAPEG